MESATIADHPSGTQFGKQPLGLIDHTLDAEAFNRTRRAAGQRAAGLLALAAQQRIINRFLNELYCDR
jgi:hypothetical protein